MDELLPYYNRELAYVRKLGAAFAEKHPKIAGRLRLSQEMTEDPHVSRLVEAFAFLNARIRRKIDDEFPEITRSLLETLYPHALAPMPSCCIAKFTPDEALAQLAEAPVIARGTEVESEPIDGQPCRFRTCYPVPLWSVRVAEAGVHGAPFPAPKTPFSRGAMAVVKLQLETVSPKVKFADLSLDRLRFFLHGQPLHVHELYQRLLSNVVGVAVAAPGAGDEYVPLGADCVQPVGFGRDEGLIDYSARSFLGYRLLSEFFAFPEKFLFLDLALTRPALQKVGGQSRLDVYLFLSQSSQDLERNVDRATFQLGCTPIVNLFVHRAEPIQLKQQMYEYRIVPDARRPKANEIFSIDSVTATSPADETVEFAPLYSIEHGGVARSRQAFWHASRRFATPTADDVDHGTEMYLTLADLNAAPVELDGWVADVRLTCLNRDLPGRLPFGGGQPYLQVASGGAMAKAECLTPPTRTLRPPLEDAVLWRLVSMLSLNHLSLVDGADEGAAMREVLGLHDLAASYTSRAMIEGLASVSSRRVTARAGGAAAGGFCRGVEVTLKFDEEKFSGGGLFLFASILERFLGLYATINSFTRTRAATVQRDALVHQWPPRAAEQALV